MKLWRTKNQACYHLIQFGKKDGWLSTMLIYLFATLSTTISMESVTKCCELISLILANDPFHMKCTVVHLAAAMELGCYYFSIKKYDQAIKYFNKATTVDATFPPAWICSRNAYAIQEVTDQAMVAYRIAAISWFIFQTRVICPSDPLVYNELGVVVYHMKNSKK